MRPFAQEMHDIYLTRPALEKTARGLSPQEMNLLDRLPASQRAEARADMWDRAQRASRSQYQLQRTTSQLSSRAATRPGVSSYVGREGILSAPGGTIGVNSAYANTGVAGNPLLGTAETAMAPTPLPQTKPGTRVLRAPQGASLPQTKPGVSVKSRGPTPISGSGGWDAVGKGGFREMPGYKPPKLRPGLTPRKTPGFKPLKAVGKAMTRFATKGKVGHVSAEDVMEAFQDEMQKIAFMEGFQDELMKNAEEESTSKKILKGVDAARPYAYRAAMGAVPGAVLGNILGSSKSRAPGRVGALIGAALGAGDKALEDLSEKRKFRKVLKSYKEKLSTARIVGAIPRVKNLGYAKRLLEQGRNAAKFKPSMTKYKAPDFIVGRT